MDLPGVSLLGRRQIHPEYRGERTRDDTGTESEAETESASVLVADVSVSGEPLALTRTLEATDSTLIPNHHTVSRAGDRTLYLSAAHVSRTRLEDALVLDPSVVVSEHVSTFPDRLTYRVDVTENAVLLAPTSLELGARALSVRGYDGQWNVRLQFPDREALVALRQFCSEANVRFGIDSLYRTDWTADARTNLTERQRETLLTAFELGYFDVPRMATQDDLAEKLGVSTSAVSHRLRRATSQLVRDSFGDLDDHS